MSELSELFARDPLHLTDQDLEKIVNRMREAQAQFELGVKTPKAERAPKAPKVPKANPLLKDLGLE